MEVVTASLLVISAIQALIASHVSTDAEQIDLREMEDVGEDILLTIDRQPADDPMDGYSSRLEMLLSEGDLEGLRENITERMPDIYSFDLYLSNGFTSIPLGTPTEPIGDAVTATRLIHLKEHPYEITGEVFQVQLLIWRERR